MTSRLRCWLVTLLASVSAPAAVFSQSTEHESARTPVRDSVPAAARLAEWRAKLRSSNPSDVAWAAWGAACERAHELVPDLTQALRRALLADASVEKDFVLRALLDALVQTGATIASEDFARTRRIGPMLAPALVLASRTPLKHVDEFVAMRKAVALEERLAVDNLLLQVDRPRAVGRLLEDVRFHAYVTVTDGARRRVAGFRACALRCAENVPKGWPPVATYRLTTERAAADAVFAPGAQPVGFRRVLHSGGPLVSVSERRSFNACEHALSLLYAAAELHEPTPPIVSHVSIALSAPSDAAYLNAVEGAVRTWETAWFALLQGLAARELLSRRDMEPTAPIHFSIHDKRADRTLPLPEIAGARRTKLWR